MPQGTKIVITLTDVELQTLIMWAKASKINKRYAQRAMVILFSAENMPLPEISKKSGLSRQNCSKWRMRFLEVGIEGLKDLPRKGRPPIITSERRAMTGKLTNTKRSQGKNQWSRLPLERDVCILKTTADGNFTQGAPHEVEYWSGKSTDHEFAKKKGCYSGAYLSPSENMLILSANEESRIQTNHRIHPTISLHAKNPMSLNTLYKRRYTSSLLTALCAHERVAKMTRGNHVTAKNNPILFLKFLKRLYRITPESNLHLIMNSSTLFQDKEVIDWTQRRKRLTLYFTPTYDSWLSQTQILITIFMRAVIPDGPWRSKEHLIDQIMYYIGRYSSENARPFSWLRIQKS